MTRSERDEILQKALERHEASASYAAMRFSERTALRNLIAEARTHRAALEKISKLTHNVECNEHVRLAQEALGEQP